MKIFVKQSHLPRGIVVIYLIFALCILISFLANISPVATSLVVSILVLFCALSVKCIIEAGLYIDGAKIYYKCFKKTNINVNEIVAIKIAKSVSEGGTYTNGYSLKDSKGKQMYSMLFLKTYMDWWMPKQKDVSDICFRTNFKEYIICSCIYDQSVIDYLLTLNPYIIIF